MPTSPYTPPLTLGVETSCDDTACAVVDAAGRVLSSVVSSQISVHSPYGGVVPELASREHLSNWPVVLRKALDQAGVEIGDVGQVAATRGPGLVGSLLVGLSLGKALAFGLGVPFRAVHHLEGHLYSPFLRQGVEPALEIPPDFVGLVVSGGHTSLVEVHERHIEPLGATRDDAMGEALDKIGKRLGLPFPGGPHVDRLAELAEARRKAPQPGPPRFKVPRCGTSLDFSYSGLKTQALREIEALEQQGVRTCAEETAGPHGDWGLDPSALELLADFRTAAVGQVLDRLRRLQQQRAVGALAVSGGVAACAALRRALEQWAARSGTALFLVPLPFSGDNAAMIAHAAAANPQIGAPLLQPDAERVDDWSVTARSRLPLGTADPTANAGRGGA
jgi:N6-L-threonylcarbamoyladenine synthase